MNNQGWQDKFQKTRWSKFVLAVRGGGGGVLVSGFFNQPKGGGLN